MMLLTLALILALPSQNTPAEAMLELPAELGHMPKLRPPPADLPEPVKAVDGTFLPSPLDGYVAAVVYTYAHIGEIGQEAIDATRVADARGCTLRIDAARAGMQCPGCTWQSWKWGGVGILAGVVIGGAAVVWASR